MTESLKVAKSQCLKERDKAEPLRLCDFETLRLDSTRKDHDHDHL